MYFFHTLAEMFMFSLRWIVSSVFWLLYLPKDACWWLRMLRVELWSVEGEEQHSRESLSILCAVSNASNNKNYALKLIFGDTYRQRCLGRYWLWNIAKAIRTAPGCAMILGEFCESHAKMTGLSHWFVLPTWLFGEVELPRDAKADRKVRGNLQKVRHNDLQYEVTQDRRIFDDFYHAMYLPYIRQTFGDCADIETHQRMVGLFKRSDLLIIKAQEKSIAGQMILYDEACPSLWVMGIQDGNRDYLKLGVMGACFHFSLKYLQEKGYKRVGLGWSRPFLRDGVMRFKKDWSQKISDYYHNGFALKVLSYTPAVKAFLCHNPFIFKRQDLLYGAVFVDSDKPLSDDDIRQIDKDYFHVGLSRLFIYCLQREPNAEKSVVPAELSERLELCNVEQENPAVR
jgi:hypothetical protein